jgi:hypothetical protein
MRDGWYKCGCVGERKRKREKERVKKQKEEGQEEEEKKREERGGERRQTGCTLAKEDREQTLRYDGIDGCIYFLLLAMPPSSVEIY